MVEQGSSVVGGQITTTKQLNPLFKPVPEAALFMEKDSLVPVCPKMVGKVAVATVGAQMWNALLRVIFLLAGHVVDETT